MAILNLASFTAATKLLYPIGMEAVVFDDSPLIGWLPKKYNFEGASQRVRIRYSGVRGGASFATALAAKSTPSYVDFNVTRVHNYVLGSIDNETIAASKSQRGAIASALKEEVDSALYEFGRVAAHQLWSDGTGSRATVSAYAGGVITLTQQRDAVHFEVGMQLEKKNAAGTLLAGSLNITAVDTDAGTLTVTLVGGAANPAATDTLARLGDYTATGGDNVLSGILSWIPATAPVGGDAHFGVDRSVNPTRLAGSRLAGAGKTIEEIVFDAQAKLSINGGRADTLWMNSQRYADLCKNLQGKAWYAQNQTTVSSSGGQTGKVKVGFSGFIFPGERGPVTVLSDPNCPYAYGVMTRKAAWSLDSLGGQPHFDETGGDRFERELTADAVAFRLKTYWQLVCKRPVDNCLIDWDN